MLGWRTKGLDWQWHQLGNGCQRLHQVEQEQRGRTRADNVARLVGIAIHRGAGPLFFPFITADERRQFVSSHAPCQICIRLELQSALHPPRLHTSHGSSLLLTALHNVAGRLAHLSCLQFCNVHEHLWCCSCPSLSWKRLRYLRQPSSTYQPAPGQSSTGISARCNCRLLGATFHSSIRSSAGRTVAFRLASTAQLPQRLGV